MRRHLLFLAASAALLTAASVWSDTSLTPKGVKVVDQWIVGQTDMKLAEAPGNVVDDKANRTRIGYLDNQEAFSKLWKAWREGKAPKVDFAKHFVLVLTHTENARVNFTLALNDGILDVSVLATERAPRGMTYVLAVIERAGVKQIGKVPLKGEK